MRPLTRESQGTQQTNHENRIQSLERRVIPANPKWARVTVGVTTLPDGAETVLEFDGFSTNDPQLFGTRLSGGGTPFNNEIGDTLVVTSQLGGAYVATAIFRYALDNDLIGEVSYEHAGWIAYGNLHGVGGDDGTYAVPNYSFFSPLASAPGQQSTFDTVVGINSPFDQATGAAFGLRAYNGSGLNGGDTEDRDLAYAEMTILRWDTDDDDLTDPRVYGPGV